MFFVELVFVFSKIIMRVAVSVIIIVVFRDFAADGILYIDGEFSIVYKRAGA